MNKHVLALIVLFQILLTGFSARDLCAQRESLPFVVLSEKDELPDVSQAEADIRKVLRKKVNINLKQKSLSEIAKSLSEEFDINVKIDAVALDDEGFDPEVKLDWEYKHIRLANALNSLLNNAGLAYGISNESLLLTTESAEFELTSTVIYDVGDILAAGKPQRVAVVRRGITSSSFDFENLIQLIELECEPENWERVGGAGSSQPAEINGKQLLIISQSEPAHTAIVEFLAQLRVASGLKDEKKAVKGLDPTKPVLRVYPLQHELKSPAEDYLTLVQTVIQREWEADGNSIKAIANTLVVNQPPDVHVKILGLLTDLDVLLKPDVPRNDFDGGFGGGGFFNIE